MPNVFFSIVKYLSRTDYRFSIFFFQIFQIFLFGFVFPFRFSNFMSGYDFLPSQVDPYRNYYSGSVLQNTSYSVVNDAVWKLTVVLDYYKAMETYSRIGLLRSYGNLQSY